MILITGITGLVGSEVARQLVDLGYAVRGLVSNTPPSKLMDEDYIHRIEWVQGNILDIVSFAEACKGIDTVIHCAAVISFASSAQDRMFNTNVVGTANVVNTMLNSGIPKLIHVSSVAALGRKEGVELIDENAMWEESPDNSAYARSKYLAELEVWRGAEEGLKVTVVNPSIILGPGDTTQGSTKLFDYVQKGRPFYTDGNINFVDVRDVANAIAIIVRDGHDDERFILNGGTTSYIDFFEKIAPHFNQRPPHIKVGGLLMSIAWRLVAVYSAFSNKEPMLTKETSRIAKSNYRYVAGKSQTVLGLTYRSLDDTVKYVCAELQNRAC